MSQVPSCLRNALLGGAGLWPQPSPCLPAKGLLCALPQSSSTTLFPPGGLARVSPAHLCLGPTWQVPVHLGLHALARLLAGSAIHSRTQSAGCFTGNYYVTGLELATVSSSWGSHGLWLRSWGVKEITSVNGGQPILSKETEGMLLVSFSSCRAPFLGPGPFKMTTPDSEPHPPAPPHSWLWCMVAQRTCPGWGMVAAPGRDTLGQPSDMHPQARAAACWVCRQWGTRPARPS